MIGWTRIVTYDKGRKHPKHIEERGSVNVRAWELAILGLIGLAWWQLEELKRTTKEWSVFGLAEKLKSDTGWLSRFTWP